MTMVIMNTEVLAGSIFSLPVIFKCKALSVTPLYVLHSCI